MQTSTAGLALIQQFEGYVGHMYHDAVGIPTIGYGHVIGANETPLLTAVLSQAAATALLQRDLVLAAHRLCRQALHQRGGMAHVGQLRQRIATPSFTRSKRRRAASRLMPSPKS